MTSIFDNSKIILIYNIFNIIIKYLDFNRNKYDPRNRSNFSSDTRLNYYALNNSRIRKNYNSKDKHNINNNIIKNFNNNNIKTIHNKNFNHTKTNDYFKNNDNNYNYNINININNLIINNNNNLNNNNNNNNNNNKLNSNKSVFSKIGNDIIGKNYEIKKRITHNKNNTNIIKANNNNIESNNLVNNVIENLMEATKENFNKINTNNNNNLINSNINNNQLNKIENENKNIQPSNNINNNNIEPNINNNNNNNNNNTNLNFDTINYNVNDNSTPSSNLVTATEGNMFFNSNLWEYLFDFELVYDNRSNLLTTTNDFIQFLTNNLESGNFSTLIFSNKNLNHCYNKILKISLILLMYLKFILNDFNYDISLKSNIKIITTSLNTNLINIIDNYILINGSKDLNVNNCILLKKDFINKYNKIYKNNKIKKLNKNNNNNNNNINSYANNLSKNSEIIINHIKQMSNNFFKLGYFKPIHSIALEFFRLIDNFTTYKITNLIINNVLFYLIKEPKVANKNIVFSNNIFNLFGFANNIQPPFLPQITNNNIYTLMLDLDETLVHFFYTPSGGHFLVRPGCMNFLIEMSKIFEIGIFTAAMQEYADNILDRLDPNKTLIKYRLYRNHCSLSGMGFTKDLSKLGRDLSKVIIIDNLTDNFKLQVNNGIMCKTWLEEMKDNQLEDIGNFLKNLISKNPSDVRPIIKKVKEEINKRIKKNNVNPFKNIQIEKFLN